MEGSRYAVLIASSEFPEEPALHALSAPENDVDDLAAVLRAADRGAFADVVVLKNEPQHRLMRQIQRTLNQAGKDDLILLYYSGHGKLNRAGHLYLTAADTVLSELESSALAVAALRDLVDASSAQRVVIILDSCFSGAVRDVFSKGAVEDQLQIASSQGRGTLILTASTGIQTAQEKEQDRHSIFTKHLIHGIETGEADLDRDGDITADELYDYVHGKVRAESHQEPTRWGMDVRGRLVLANSGREPRRERAEALRSLLLELAREERIKDEVLAEALRIIRQSASSLTETEKHRDALLDELREDRISALDLVLQWVALEEAPPAPAIAGDGPAQASPTPSARQTERAEPSPEPPARQRPEVAEQNAPPSATVTTRVPSSDPASTRGDVIDATILEPGAVYGVMGRLALVWLGGLVLQYLVGSFLGV